MVVCMMYFHNKKMVSLIPKHIGEAIIMTYNYSINDTTIIEILKKGVSQYGNKKH